MWQMTLNTSSPVQLFSDNETNINVICAICKGVYCEPKVLTCFHSFCKGCIESVLNVTKSDRFVCPICNAETLLSSQRGVRSLLDDFGLAKLLLQSAASGDKKTSASAISTSSSPTVDSASGGPHQTKVCTSCKMNERASSFCHDCDSFICKTCTNAHRAMRRFEGHVVEALPDTAPSTPVVTLNCPIHTGEILTLYCFDCGVIMCEKCKAAEHDEHHCEQIEEVVEKECAEVQEVVRNATLKQDQLVEMAKQNELGQTRLGVSLKEASASVEAAARALYRVISEYYNVAREEVNAAYDSQQKQLSDVHKKIQTTLDKVQSTLKFTERLLKYASPMEVLIFKKLLVTRLSVLQAFDPDPKKILMNCEIAPPKFTEEYVLHQTRALMGLPNEAIEVPGIERAPLSDVEDPRQHLNRMHKAMTAPSLTCYGSRVPATYSFSSSPSLAPVAVTVAVDGDGDPLGRQLYEKWSGAPTEVTTAAIHASELSECEGPVESALPLVTSPTVSHIKRHRMTYHAMFGDCGIIAWQFSEPSGVAVTSHNDFAVVDTNSHRVSVFAIDGRFKFHFGDQGKNGGQLLYPNRIAVSMITGEFVVTERAPAHQVQVFSQYGKFVRKFGANILRHPRGVCVDALGRIIVVECKVMRIVIFDRVGETLRTLECAPFLEFPNGIASNHRGELFVSDNRAHCVKVFDYEGHYLRQIGGEGLTNFPIGVGVNDAGEVVIADNHNSFNLTIFSQDGRFLSAFESRVKHAQCFDMALLHGIRSLILASRDFRVFLYRYDVYAAL